MPGTEVSHDRNAYAGELEQDGSHPAYREKSRSRSGERRVASSGSIGSREGGEVQPHYTETERREMAQAGMI